MVLPTAPGKYSKLLGDHVMNLLALCVEPRYTKPQVPLCERARKFFFVLCGECIWLSLYNMMAHVCLGVVVGEGYVEKERPRSRDLQTKAKKMILRLGPSQAAFKSDDAIPGSLQS